MYGALQRGKKEEGRKSSAGLGQTTPDFEG